MQITKSFLIGAAALVGTAACVVLLLGAGRFRPGHDSIDNLVFHYTTPPPIPADMQFAGQQIDLRRYDMRERIDRELMAYTYMHSTTMLTLKRANRYFPVIERILRECGVPDDLKYLAVVESSLNPLARSGAGAAGMWQFMRTTGREYGLEVNDNIDERYHVEKATRAACAYLKEAYAKYGDWLSVAASYNGGQRRISTELQRQHAARATDLWLVEETSRYMFRLLAAKAVFSHPRRYGFVLDSGQLYPPIACRYDTVTVPVDDLPAYAISQGVGFAQLKDANPWLRQYSLENKSGRTYVVSIPLQQSVYYDPARTKAYNKEWVTD